MIHAVSQISGGNVMYIIGISVDKSIWVIEKDFYYNSDEYLNYSL